LDERREALLEKKKKKKEEQLSGILDGRANLRRLLSRRKKRWAKNSGTDEEKGDYQRETSGIRARLGWGKIVLKKNRRGPAVSRRGTLIRGNNCSNGAVKDKGGRGFVRREGVQYRISSFLISAQVGQAEQGEFLGPGVGAPRLGHWDDEVDRGGTVT